ncbi:MAG: glycosyl transferase [Acidipropionibacterium sp.]|jgi:glycosyltransferase involved in cell wall biosynthesis|nr:glycosyl transferase [Acidipropionibacterium sp.]
MPPTSDPSQSESTTVHRCIYHLPYPLDMDSRFGGQVRPARMMEALSEWGEVWLVAGTAAQRRRQMRIVDDAVARGVRFDFCYSESSTMPTALTEAHHLPTHPVEDFAFLARLRRHGVPVGLFYRDIHWRFPMYGKGLSPVRRRAALAMYHYDLAAYGRCLDVIFLPSLQMAEYVDLPSTVKLAELPPGHDIVEEPTAAAPHPLSLFYVGGFGDNYRMDRLLEAVHGLPQVHLTVCTRPEEWDAARPRVGQWAGDNVEVVHAQGSRQLAPHFARCNVATLAVEPQPYWTFAAPLKLYEYIGNGKPILASEGTLAGSRVADGGLGWTVPYTVEALGSTLAELSAHPEQVDRARDAVMAVRHSHSWAGRVEQLAGVLADVDRRNGPGEQR